MLLQYGGAFELVEVKRVLGGTGDGVAVYVTSAGEHQAVIATQMSVTVGIFPAPLFRVREDLLDVTLQEVDAGNVKQRLQWCDQRMNGTFIKAWADTQLRLWRNYCNINCLLMFIRQSCGA